MGQMNARAKGDDSMSGHLIRRQAQESINPSYLLEEYMNPFHRIRTHEHYEYNSLIRFGKVYLSSKWLDPDLDKKVSK